VVAQAVLGLLLIATHLSELVLAIHESVGVAAVVLLTAAAVRATARMPDVGERPAIDVSP
jgi:heme A synthase